MAYFHTTVLDNQIKALPTVDTASGSIATFDTDMTENLVEVVCNIQYSQASGTPTPVNPLLITVYTSLNLSHSGADTSNPNVTNIPFGQTVAQGFVNVGTGKVTINNAITTINDLNLTYNTTGTRFTSNDLISTIKRPPYNTVPLEGLSCECYDVSVSQSSSQVNLSVAVNTAGTVCLKDTDYTDEASLKSAVGNYKIVYPLATPIEIQLDSITLQALLNENNIWCDTGDTEVKFLLSVGKKIS